MRSLRTSTYNESLVFDEKMRKGFIRSHSLIIVASFLIVMYIIAYFRNNTNSEQNIFLGHLSVILLVLIIAVLAAPDGPFTRPHPLFWRLSYGLSLVYLMTLLYIFFQNHKTVKSVIFWFFPDLMSVTDVFQKPYDINCTVYTVQNIFSKTDVYTFGHFFGWIVKALLIRHYGVCWLLSITWEVTELAFDNLLPFSECWWDSIVLDVLLTNGLGIYAGMRILKVLNLETYDWDSFEEEHMAHMDSRQALMQFSSEARDVLESFDHLNSYVRVMAFFVFNMFWQITELNTFFQMQIFDVPADHPLAVGRLVVITLIVAPLVPEYLIYIKQSDITDISPRCWIFPIIVVMEALLNIRYESKIMANFQIWMTVLWFIIMVIYTRVSKYNLTHAHFQLFFCIICLALCIYWSKQKSTKSEPDTCIEKV